MSPAEKVYIFKCTCYHLFYSYACLFRNLTTSHWDSGVRSRSTFGEGKPTEGLYTVAWKGSAKNGAFEHLDFKGVDDNEGELFSGYINIC